MNHRCPVLLFYKYVFISDPGLLRDTHRAFCNDRRIKGRVLIAEEGINGTLSGPADAVTEYEEFLKKDDRFADMDIKKSWADEIPFPRLAIKVRPEIVTLQADQALEADQDNHLNPDEWKSMIENDPEVVLVDVRNNYESAVGHFSGAVTCDIRYFRELPVYLQNLEHLKERKVLMYCTGGIRCEKASALFRSRGFQNVYQLHGGIVKYQESFGNEHWKGECFVFDERMSTKVEQNLETVGRCAHTGVATSRFVNCANDLCHRLFILSEEAEQNESRYRFCPRCFEEEVD